MFIGPFTITYLVIVLLVNLPLFVSFSVPPQRSLPNLLNPSKKTLVLFRSRNNRGSITNTKINFVTDGRNSAPIVDGSIKAITALGNNSELVSMISKRVFQSVDKLSQDVLGTKITDQLTAFSGLKRVAPNDIFSFVLLWRTFLASVSPQGLSWTEFFATSLLVANVLTGISNNSFKPQADGALNTVTLEKPLREISALMRNAIISSSALFLLPPTQFSSIILTYIMNAVPYLLYLLRILSDG